MRRRVVALAHADDYPIERRAEKQQRIPPTTLAVGRARSDQLFLSLAGFLRFGIAANPAGRVKPAGDTAAKRRMRPICQVSDETMLDRVEVDVIEMNGKVPIIADRVLPIAALPDAALAAANHHPGSRFDSGQRFGKRDLDRAPTAGKVGIACGKVHRQCIRSGRTTQASI